MNFIVEPSDHVHLPSIFGKMLTPSVISPLPIRSNGAGEWLGPVNLIDNISLLVSGECK
ncbi:MAG: hypothetical protein J6577_07215 [Gilliamella sp.]|nr:hypothetical protein [Gilliamella sp.]